MSADQTPVADPTPGSGCVDVAGLRALLGEATERSWAVVSAEFRDQVAYSVKRGDRVVAFVGYDSEGARPGNDAELIAAARNALPALLDERDDLAARLATAEAAVERLVRAVQDEIDWLYAHHDGSLVTSDYPLMARRLAAALAPLDPDAPTGHDGHGDPGTHQGDTEAGDGR